MGRAAVRRCERISAEVESLVRILLPYDPERIILFGSRARGQSDQYSDYDVVVIKRSGKAFLERQREVVPYVLQFPKPIEILVYTPEEFDRMKETGLGWVVRREGVVIYERRRD